MGVTSAFDPIRLALAEGCPPAWASGWGEGRRGVFVEFTLEGVTQRLRWIPAGRFMMGSPQEELGRSELGRPEWEWPQHEVIFNQGFWLFDTACSQALWQVVMAHNSSQFKSPKRPVENESWFDVQDFLSRINRQIPGLKLGLPSEAQWEYACRAGTNTPFSFGEIITPEQVNYSGNYPYADVAKGEHRQKTVSVASLPPNPWGLYEMHGNVWEWCADQWHDSYVGAPSDGQAWISPNPGSQLSAEHVVRGGAWFDSAHNVRAAFRGKFQPDLRFDWLGFRCSRVHS